MASLSVPEAGVVGLWAPAIFRFLEGDLPWGREWKFESSGLWVTNGRNNLFYCPSLHDALRKHKVRDGTHSLPPPPVSLIWDWLTRPSIFPS